MIDTGFAALAAARWIHFVSVMLLFGASLFPFYALPRQAMSPELACFPGALRAAAILAALSGLVWAAVSLVNITGDPATLLDRDTVTAFLFDTGFGKIWVLRLLLLLALLITVMNARADLGARNFATARVLLFAASLLVSQAWIGHAAASTEHERAFVILGYAMHVLGAGAWLGGLVPLWLMLRGREADQTREANAEAALYRFSAVGMFAIALILAGGVINAWTRWNSLDVLLASTWGKVLIAKVLGFAAVLSLALVNRFALMPRSRTHPPARAQLIRNILVEQAGGVAIVAAAAVLGILPPPA